MCQNQYFADCSFKCSLSGISMCEYVYGKNQVTDSTEVLIAYSCLPENPSVRGAPVSMVQQFPYYREFLILLINRVD